MGLRRKG